MRKHTRGRGRRDKREMKKRLTKVRNEEVRETEKSHEMSKEDGEGSGI